VTRGRYVNLPFILLTLCLTLLWMRVPPAAAQVTVTYSVSQEWVKIWINRDGSIDILYNITLTYLSGSPEGIVTVGMPKGGFRIQSVKDLSGTNLSYSDVSRIKDNYYGIEVFLKRPVILGRPNTFTVYAVVPGMVYNDNTNPGNVGMLFYPTTFSNTSTSIVSGSIASLRVAIALPQGVTSDEAKYLRDTPFDNVFVEGNNLVVYWERGGWSPASAFTVGVSFPENYVSLAPAGPNIGLYAGIGAVAACLTVAGVVTVMYRKGVYERPRIAVEALGARRDLTAVEAGVVLDLKPVRVLTMILFGLLLKRMVIVTATDPLIKLQRLERPASEPSPPSRYYEIDYLKAVESDGGLDEMVLARTYLGLRDTVDQKLRGYSRGDTVNYYRSIVNNAWTQVTQAETPELKGDAVDQNIEWLLADDKFDERFRTTFPPEVIILPRPGWWWYWGGPHFPPGQARVPPTTPTEARPIPGQDFANNVVRGLEKASNNMVKNVQDFANRLIPARAAAETERPVRSQSSCVCACAHCACACACVGCACACAGGGAR